MIFGLLVLGCYCVIGSLFNIYNCKRAVSLRCAKIWIKIWKKAAKLFSPTSCTTLGRLFFTLCLNTSRSAGLNIALFKVLKYLLWVDFFSYHPWEAHWDARFTGEIIAKFTRRAWNLFWLRPEEGNSKSAPNWFDKTAPNSPPPLPAPVCPSDCRSCL